MIVWAELHVNALIPEEVLVVAGSMPVSNGLI